MNWNISTIFIYFLSTLSFSQTPIAQESIDGYNQNERNIAYNERSFRGVTLGMSYNQTLPILKKDPLIMVSPNSDFEDFDEENPNWIIAKMPPLMKRIYYHFYEQKLYVISIFFNRERTSFPELYRKLKKKYGKAEKLHASQAIWQVSEQTTVILDALPSIKYIDTPTLKSIEPLKSPIDDLITNEHALEQEILDDL